MKYIALVGAVASINLNRDFDSENIFNEFVVEREGEQPVHLIQMLTPPGGAPTWPSPPTTPGRGFTTTQEPGMGKDWPAGGAVNKDGEVFETNPQWGGHHEEDSPPLKNQEWVRTGQLVEP